MTTREFIQHLILNGEMNDTVCVEGHSPDGTYYCFTPEHVCHIGDYDNHPETLIECRLKENK